MSDKISIPVCLVGSITEIPNGPSICMDGATHLLVNAAPVPIRLKATNPETEKALGDYTDAKILVQICGYHREGECHRLDIYSLSVAASEPAELINLPTPQSCRLLPFTSADVVAGFVNETYFLNVDGSAPCYNMKVSLQPRIYIQQPEYWGVEVVGCLEGGFCQKAIRDWSETISLDSIRGTKGIEVIGADKSKKIDIPASGNIASIGAALNQGNERLADANTITAQQLGDSILLSAFGLVPTPNTTVKFVQTELEIYPPQYKLMEIPPANPDLQVITPFGARASFPANGTVGTVVVYDANGENQVKVEQINT